MAAAFERAQDLGAMFSDTSMSFVDVFVTRVAQQFRMLIEAGDNGKSSCTRVIDSAHLQISPRSWRLLSVDLL